MGPECEGVSPLYPHQTFLPYSLSPSDSWSSGLQATVPAPSSPVAPVTIQFLPSSLHSLSTCFPVSTRIPCAFRIPVADPLSNLISPHHLCCLALLLASAGIQGHFLDFLTLYNCALFITVFSYLPFSCHCLFPVPFL